MRRLPNGIGDHLEYLVTERHAPRVGGLDECERLAGKRVEVQPRHSIAVEVVDQVLRVLPADCELQPTDELVGVAEQHHGVVVAGHRLEVFEHVHGGWKTPKRNEVAGDLLLHRRGGLQEALVRDIAGQRNQCDVVGEGHEDSLRRGGRGPGERATLTCLPASERLLALPL